MHYPDSQAIDARKGDSLVICPYLTFMQFLLSNPFTSSYPPFSSISFFSSSFRLFVRRDALSSMQIPCQHLGASCPLRCYQTTSASLDIHPAPLLHLPVHHLDGNACATPRFDHSSFFIVIDIVIDSCGAFCPSKLVSSHSTMPVTAIPQFHLGICRWYRTCRLTLTTILRPVEHCSVCPHL